MKETKCTELHTKEEKQPDERQNAVRSQIQKERLPEMDAPIGVFDSGVGGLTVVREIMRNLPNERIVYFGDTARVPYGSKSPETIIRFSKQISRFLQSQNVKAIVIACNTASALALDAVEAELNIPIIGVIRPGAYMAAHATQNKRVGIIGTESTIRSRMYDRLIQEQDPEIVVFGKACPLFVPLVEEGWLKDSVTEEVAKRYLSELLRKDIDTLVLGCTHYPLIRSLIGKIAGEQVTLVNPAYETAQELHRLLSEKNLLNDGTRNIKEQMHQFYVSDAAEKFGEFANSILPYDVKRARQIPIEEY